jgi:hypothetical protein
VANSRAAIEVVEAPPLRASSVGGYGSGILARPGTAQVVFSRQIGSPRTRWLTFDVAAGTFQEGTGFPGDLRAGVFDDDGAWLLGTHGVCRVSFDPPRVIEILRRGLGSYQQWLHRLTPTRLVVAASQGKTAAVVDTERKAVAKRLRMPAPDLALTGERPRLCAFHAGEARELDLTTLRLGEPIPIPEATSPFAFEAAVFAMVGPRAPYGRVLVTEHIVGDSLLRALGPAGRLIRRITHTPSAEAPLGYAIQPERFVSVPTQDMSVQRTGGDARGLTELIGATPNGFLVATGDSRLALIDPASLEVADQIDVPYPTHVACWVPEVRTAVLLLHYLVAPPPAGFDPLPEKLVLVALEPDAGTT